MLSNNRLDYNSSLPLLGYVKLDVDAIMQDAGSPALFTSVGKNNDTGQRSPAFLNRLCELCRHYLSWFDLPSDQVQTRIVLRQRSSTIPTQRTHFDHESVASQVPLFVIHKQHSRQHQRRTKPESPKRNKRTIFTSFLRISTLPRNRFLSSID